MLDEKRKHEKHRCSQEQELSFFLSFFGSENTIGNLKIKEKKI